MVTLLASLALLLLFAGTYLLAASPYVWDGWLLVGVALAALATLSAPGQSSPGRVRAWVASLVPRRTAGWVRVGTGAVSLAVALGARQRSQAYDYAGLFVLWAVAIAAFVLSLAPSLLEQPQTARLLRGERWGLIVLLVVAGLVRGLFLGRVPVNLGGDEGTQLALGLDLLTPPMGNPFATGWFSVPTLSFTLYGISMRIFGTTMAGGRALSAIVGTLTVFTTFLLGRAVGGRRIGWIAAGVVAVSAYHIHYSRLASNQIFDPLVGTLTLWLVWRAIGPLRKAGPSQTMGRLHPSGPQAVGVAPGTAAWGVAGIVAGLGWYAYFGARWVVFLVALVVLWRLWIEPTFLREHWKGLLLFAAGWLVAVLPLLGWYSVNPSAASERYSAVSIFASGWLARETEITGRSALQLLLQQAWRSATAFHSAVDPTFWYRPDQPLVDFLTGGLLLLGLVEALRRIRWPSRSLVLLWFWSTLAMAWILTENPPSSQRGLLLVPAVGLFVSWGIEHVGSRFLRQTLSPAHLVAAFLLAVGLLNLVFYFGVYTPRRVYGNPTAESATAFARYTLANPAPVCDPAPDGPCPGRIYFAGPPWLYWEFGTLSFMLRRFPGENVAPGTVPEAVQVPARFALVPVRLDELADLRSRFPGGTETRLTAPDGRLLMVVYDWVG